MKQKKTQTLLQKMAENTLENIVKYTKDELIQKGTLYVYIQLQKLRIFGQGYSEFTKHFNDPQTKSQPKSILRKQLIVATSTMLSTALDMEHELNEHLAQIEQNEYEEVYKRDYTNKIMQNVFKLVRKVCKDSYYVTKDTYINSIDKFKGEFNIIRSPEAGEYMWYVAIIPTLFNLLDPDLEKHQSTTLLSINVLKKIIEKENTRKFSWDMFYVNSRYSFIMKSLLIRADQYVTDNWNEESKALFKSINGLNDLFI
eukprot:GAHX01001247.1.p1 GENE.GAHX01001247.1~~GAHX01001247.1.p1  ORF type:complete len:256 (-),score=35.60 GAHX01001247.1:42-809(-)